VKEFVDEKGNLVFEINLRQIIINIFKLRVLTGANILSVFGHVKSFSDDGEAFREGNEKKGWIRLNLSKIVDPKDKNSVIQRKIIKSLSHEVRHIFQPESKSGLLKFCRKLHIILFLPLTIMCVLGVIAQIVTWKVEFKVPIYLTILLIFFPAFLIFMVFFYFLDPEERDARKFEKEAIKDKQWLEIVQVKTIKEK